MALDLCNLSFTWSSDKSPTCVTKFTYVDVTDLKDEETSCTPIENGRLIEEVEFSSEKQMWLTREGSDEDFQHCTLHLVCPRPEFAQINGVSVVSESRTLEISARYKGYLTTVRGRKINTKSQRTSQAAIDGSSPMSLYNCSCYLDESCSSLSLKFLSLGDRAAFCVLSIRINIIQHNLQTSPVKGSLDVSRLKKDIEDMGSVMSERAKDFMSTLEQYEKNKIDKVGGLMSSTLSNPSMGASTNGLSTLMSSILGAGTMKSLASSNIGADGDKQDIYNILNSVCGSVANLRMASVKQKEEAGESAVGGNDKTSLKEDVENSHTELQSIAVITEKVEQIKLELHSEMLEMKQEILDKVNGVKLEVNQKLDSILSLLQKLDLVKENT